MFWVRKIYLFGILCESKVSLFLFYKGGEEKTQTREIDYYNNRFGNELPNKLKRNVQF